LILNKLIDKTAHPLLIILRTPTKTKSPAGYGAGSLMDI
jgi:hypothetical protein